MFALILFGCKPTTNVKSDSRPAYSIVIHGGAGTILKENMTPEKEKIYYDKMNEALDKGENILKNGGSSLDAVVETIKILEDSPLFNSAKGAVYTSDGTHELDASIMNGEDTNGGAVAGVTNIKNPITAARAGYEKSNHVLLSGKGAEAFAQMEGCEVVENSYFDTEDRLKTLQRLKAKESQGFILKEHPDYKYGTVGCVALDNNGNIVAGTSTGGMSNKKYNRIGDSPILGAGTYADNNTCGVSSTGHGEFFIRYAVAYDIAARMEYANNTLDEAAKAIVHGKLKDKGGAGGIVALDRNGNISMEFNTPGMYRGYRKPGEKVVLMY
jgi:beta-aspartyl-peptidase (threonine type)